MAMELPGWAEGAGWAGLTPGSVFSYRKHLFSGSNHEKTSNSQSEKSWILDSQKQPLPKSLDYTRKRRRVRRKVKGKLSLCHAQWMHKTAGEEGASDGLWRRNPPPLGALLGTSSGSLLCCWYPGKPFSLQCFQCLPQVVAVTTGHRRWEAAMLTCLIVKNSMYAKHTNTGNQISWCHPLKCSNGPICCLNVAGIVLVTRDWGNKEVVGKHGKLHKNSCAWSLSKLGSTG